MKKIPKSIDSGMIAVLAPVRSVKAGELISTIEAAPLYWPKNLVTEDMVQDIAEFKDYRTTDVLNPGVPILKSQLMRAGKRTPSN